MGKKAKKGNWPSDYAAVMRRFEGAIPAKIEGFYGTAHTRDGRFLSLEPPTAIRINSERILLEMPVKEALIKPTTIDACTLHIGEAHTSHRIDPSVSADAGSFVTVLIPLTFTLGENV